VQVNGKLRDRITVAADATEEQIQAAALASEVIQKFLSGATPRKIIVAQKRLVNLVL
jgi:leucyl-tRNA synthetase